MKRIYLDHNATCPLRPVARRVLAEAHTWGNPSSAHAEGRAARRALEQAREQLADVLECEPGEIVFTSGGTESNALALQSVAGAGPVVATAIEHPSILRWPGVEPLAVDTTGLVDLSARLARASPATPALVSVGWANHEVGVVQDVIGMVERAHAVGALAHSDASQAVGRIPVSFRAANLDLMTVSAHKLGGPVGIGALVVRRGVQLPPLLHGGDQQDGRRAGTEPVALAAAFAAAAVEAVGRQAEQAVDSRRWRDALWAALGASSVELLANSSPAGLPNTLNVSFPGRPGPSLVHRLDLEGVSVSHGSACASGSLEPSPVLLAMGAGEERARSAVRISFGPGNTDADVTDFTERLLLVLDAVRARSER